MKKQKRFVRKVEWEWINKEISFKDTFTNPIYILAIIIYLSIFGGDIVWYVKLIGVAFIYVAWHLIDIIPIPKRKVYYEEV